MTPPKNIDDLFTMFHDIKVVSVDYDTETLTLFIKLPWILNMPDDFFLDVHVELFGCTEFVCTYSATDPSHENLTQAMDEIKYDEIKTNDTKIISELQLLIQLHEKVDSSKYVLHCNSKQAHIGGAKLYLVATDYSVFDFNGTEISENQLEKWWGDYWEQ